MRGVGEVVGEVTSFIRANHPLLVLMIRVLDMLREPVLDPVDHLAVNGHLGNLMITQNL